MKRLAILLLLPLAGCLSGLGAGDATPIRYFSAEAVIGSSGARPVEGAPALRLRPATAAAHLRERMVWRVSDVEYGFYETRRWTELPVAWLESALERTLFEEHGVTRSDRAAAPTLSVHLVGFEERLGPHEARVAVELRLGRPGGDVLLQRRVEASEPIGADDPVQVAQALARALEVVVEGAAGAAVAALMAEE